MVENRIYDYLIIGAGPGGIQMGYYFEKAGRDYLILERSDIAGSFFAKYPRHRKLISINKKHIGALGLRKDVDHNEVRLRYDWNSLLCDDPEFRFTSYTDEYFPNADLYVKYLDDYVKKYGIKIEFGVEIKKISRDKEGIFQLSSQNKIYQCKNLIVATGMSKPNIPRNIPGIEHAIGYEELDMDLEKYRNKHILVLGMGNSAFEVADWLTPVAAYINVSGRSPLRLAWKSHYVGDVRALNNNFLDTFQLKSNNILDFWDDLWITKKENGKLIFRDELPFEYDYIIRCFGFLFDHSIFDQRTCSIDLDKNGKIPKIKVNYESTSVENLYFVGTSAQALDYHKSSSAFIHGFRYTAKFLYNFLEYGINFPTEVIKIESKETIFTQISDKIIDLVNESSSIFQLFQHYCYVIIFSEEVTMIKEPIPVDFIKHLKNMIKDYNFMVITMDYGFDSDEDVFQPFPIYDVFNGIQSRFLHPVIKYYLNYDHFDNENYIEYDHCVCGRWETAEYLKKETICRVCIKKGYCFCGNTEDITWFIKNNKCQRCLEGKPYTSDELFTKFYVDESKPINGYFSHHIAEDVSAAFKRGIKGIDDSYKFPLIRYLEGIFLNRRIPLIGQFLGRIKKISDKDSLNQRPFQLRFWTFNSHIFLRTPDGEEMINDFTERQRYLYSNNKRIKDGAINAMNSLYKEI